MTLKKNMLITLSALIVLMVAARWAQASGPSAFLPEPMHLFDPVPEGVEVSHEFILINRGDEPLVIERLKSG